MIRIEKFGNLPDGREVNRYILTNQQGVCASFTDLGGVWTSMIVPDRTGNMTDVVLGYDTAADYYKNPPHFGALIGRNANRIAGADFMLNGKQYALAANNGPNNLHSGPDYYHSRLWDADIQEDELGSTISFSLKSPDGDQGFPGNADITAGYTLTQDNAVIISYHMVCDQDTIANFTNHSYFNLSGHDSGNAMEDFVWIDADTYTAADAVSIPTKEVLPVKGTPMDFTVMKPIVQDLEADYDALILGKGYDHNWILNHTPKELALSAKAKSNRTGIVMEVYTDLPGMQFYTANFLEATVGKGGVHYGRRHAYCFETQFYPDSIHNPLFPSPILRTGQEYQTTTIYKFLTELK